MIPEKINSNIKLETKPTDKKHIINKEYVDNKIQTKTWEQYNLLSEEDKNGVTFFVPDLPIDSSGKVIGDVEYGNFKLDDNYNITSSSEVAVKELIPFKSLLNSEGNMTSNNGLVPLKKGKTYKIVAAIRTGDTSQTDIGYLEFCLYDNKGNLLKQGIANNGLVTRGIYPIVYTITPKEDISVGIYITYRTPPVTVIVGENRSYFNITEIPSYTGLLDCSDDHIKSLVPEGIKSNASVNLKTLDNGYTSRIVEVDTGLILDYFKDDETNSDINRMYIGNDGKTLKLQKYSNGVLVDDYNLCKTKINDVSTTSITTSGLSSGYISYSIKNGICTVSLNSIKVNEGGKIQYITSGANIPNQINKNSWHQIFTTDGKCVFVRPDSNGEIQVYSNCDANYMYHGTIMYVVS